MNRPENILITGIAGYVGSHLADVVLAEAPEANLHGLERRSTSEITFPNLAHLQGRSNFRMHAVDMADAEALSKLVTELRPSHIFHMAARSHVAPSFANPAETLVTNTVTTLNLFEAVRAAQKERPDYNPVILNPGSSDQYGYVKLDELPVRENQPFRPTNPYAVSKVTQEMLGYQYYRSYKLHIISTRAFNSLGPRQSPELATAAFARQIALAELQAEKGLDTPAIRVGNLDSSRDYTDVRDIARGYWLGATGPQIEPGTPYNLCSGQDWQLKTVLDMLVEIATCPLKVEFDPARARPSDIPVVRGDYSRFKEATGWQPRISLEQSLRDLLNYFREEVRK